eukprot:1684903-Rhodomonas_salina.1
MKVNFLEQFERVSNILKIVGNFRALDETKPRNPVEEAAAGRDEDAASGGVGAAGGCPVPGNGGGDDGHVAPSSADCVGR